MKAEARTNEKQDEAQLIKVFQELMGLYSAAIEYYNRDGDEEL